MTAQTPTIHLKPIGTNYPALAIPGTEQVRGLVIDNPSGAWLLLRTTGDFIPPYTIGFARSFDVGRTSVAIEYVAAGPAGQVSTLAGDPARVVLSSEPVGNSAGNSSPGSPFIQQFTPVITGAVSAAFSASTGMIGQIIFAAVANKRYRVLTVRATQAIFSAAPPNPNYNWDNGLYYVVYSSSLAVRPGEGRLNPMHLIDHTVYPSGLDCPIGDSIKADAYSDWANNSINIIVSAQLI